MKANEKKKKNEFIVLVDTTLSTVDGFKYLISSVDSDGSIHPEVTEFKLPG